MKCVRTVCNQDFSPLPWLVRTSLVPGKYLGMTDNSPKIHLDNDGFVVQFHFYNMCLTIGNDSLTNWHVYVNDGFIDINGMHACLHLSLRKGNTTRDQEIFTLRVLICPWCCWLIFLLNKGTVISSFQGRLQCSKASYGLTVMRKKDEYTVKMTTVQVVETSVTVNNSPIQDYVHPDDHTQPTYKMICQGN